MERVRRHLAPGQEFAPTPEAARYLATMAGAPGAKSAVPIMVFASPVYSRTDYRDAGIGRLIP